MYAPRSVVVSTHARIWFTTYINGTGPFSEPELQVSEEDSEFNKICTYLQYVQCSYMLWLHKCVHVT